MSSINQDITIAIQKLKGVVGEVSARQRQAILRAAAKPVVSAAKANVKDSKEVHYRYATAKASSGIRAPKGSGNIVASYDPGNLRNSIAVLTFSKAPASVFVGPKLEKQGAKGEYGGTKVDGYYAAMVEAGTVNFAGQYYMRRAFNSEKDAVIAEVSKKVALRIKAYVKKHQI